MVSFWGVLHLSVPVRPSKESFNGMMLLSWLVVGCEVTMELVASVAVFALVVVVSGVVSLDAMSKWRRGMA